MKLRLILIALMALLAFNASETSLADNNTRTSGNTTTGTGYFQNGRPFVVISKEEMKMRVYDATGRELRCYPIACGRMWATSGVRATCAHRWDCLKCRRFLTRTHGHTTLKTVKA